MSPYSKYIAQWASRRGLSPNQISVVSMVFAVGAALAFATGNRAGYIGGAVAVQAMFTFDCVDGQLARYDHRFSVFGEWLDAFSDRAKEIVLFVGLVFGARANDDEHIWAFALAALALQTVRHMVLFSWTDHAAEPAVASPADAATHGLLHWAKKIIILPIGERLLLISVVTAIWGPRRTFQALLVWGAIALVYTVAGRIMRSRGDHQGFTWLLDPALCAAEYAVIIAVSLASDDGSGAAVFAWLVPVVLHRYDTVYRLEALGTPPSRWRRAAMLTWPGRILVAIVAASLGIADPVGYVCGALSGAVLLGDIIFGWRSFFAGEREVEAP